MKNDIYEWLDSITPDIDQKIGLLEVLQLTYHSAPMPVSVPEQEIKNAIEHLTAEKYLLG